MISTDYKDYSLVYGCTRRSGELCNNAHMALFGRKTTLKQESLTIATGLYSELCIDEDDLVSTTHDQGKV